MKKYLFIPFAFCIGGCLNASHISKTPVEINGVVYMKESKTKYSSVLKKVDAESVKVKLAGEEPGVEIGKASGDVNEYVGQSLQSAAKVLENLSGAVNSLAEATKAVAK